MIKIKGRGSNPSSHRNKPKLGVQAKEINLTPAQWEVAKQIGGGGDRDYSKGVRQLVDFAISLGATDADKLFSRLPAIGQAKLAIQLLLEGHPKAQELAEAVLIDLEDLEIENLYQEAIVEGNVKPTKGAWIA